MGLLDGRVAVVTGAGRGLGRAYALALAGAGARVLVNDRERDMAAAVAAETGGVADSTDVSSVAGGRTVVLTALGALGRVDVVVNNAGHTTACPLADLDEAFLEGHLAVHLKGSVGVMQAAAEVMRPAGWGRIINIVSDAGLRPFSGQSVAYAAAKGALYSATLAAAFELAGTGITANAVSPNAMTRTSRDYLNAAGARALDWPTDTVAAVVTYLASALSDGVTGRILRVAGTTVREVRMLRQPAGTLGDLSPAGVARVVAPLLAMTEGT